MSENIVAIYKETVQKLSTIYPEAEAQSITNILFEDIIDIPRTKRLTQPELRLTPTQVKKYHATLKRVLNHEPIQHIAGFTYFYGHRFLVNTSTLIPRPETEELVDLIIRENDIEGLAILDVGTGSGCIPISLVLALKKCSVTSWDISESALETANTNCQLLGAEVTVSNVNIMTYSGEQKFDLIVSNPPYIPEMEKQTMDQNVVTFEPEIALFVPDADPLLFYRAIGKTGLSNLNDNGKLYFEIHENYGLEVKSLLLDLGYKHVEIIKDMQRKDRMIRAFR